MGLRIFARGGECHGVSTLLKLSRHDTHASWRLQMSMGTEGRGEDQATDGLAKPGRRHSLISSSFLFLPLLAPSLGCSAEARPPGAPPPPC